MIETDREIDYEEIEKRGYAPAGCYWWFDYCKAHEIPYIVYHHRKGSLLALIEFDFITVKENGVMLSEQASREVFTILNEYRRYKGDETRLHQACYTGSKTVRWDDVFVVLDMITPIIMNQNNWIMLARDGGRDECGDLRWEAYTSE